MSAAKPSSENNPSYDVLTLPEVAAFLRVPDDAIMTLIANGSLPAQRIGSEWRLLKQAVVEWLRRGQSAGTKQAVLRHFGVFEADGDLEEHLAQMRALREATGR